MTNYDRALLLFVLIACFGFGFMGRKETGKKESVSLHVVTVTNTVTAVASSLGSASSSPVERQMGERVTVEYCPVSFSSSQDDRWAYAQGRLFRLGMAVPQGRVVDIQNWGIRIVGSCGEHFIYNYDNSLVAQNQPLAGGVQLGAVKQD